MNKIKEHIKIKIKNDLEQFTLDCAHGINNTNIHEYLITPVKEKYLNGIDSNKHFYLWTVLEEDPKDKKGYTIFYDEERNDFGLGTHTNEGLIYLGNYGSFSETINSM